MTFRQKIAVVEERLKGTDRALKLEARSQYRALKLQAKEYKRRLNELNHAHAQARETFSTFTPRELFEGFLKETENWRRKVDAFMTANSAEAATGKANRANLISFVSIAIAVASVLLAFLKKG